MKTYTCCENTLSAWEITCIFLFKGKSGNRGTGLKIREDFRRWRTAPEPGPEEIPPGRAFFADLRVFSGRPQYKKARSARFAL